MPAFERSLRHIFTILCSEFFHRVTILIMQHFLSSCKAPLSRRGRLIKFDDDDDDDC